jgi:predicted transcriptional regulator
MGRVTTIRVPMDLYDELEAVARVDGMSVSAVVRAAVGQHVERRMADPVFRAKAAAMVARDSARVAALADRPAGSAEPVLDWLRDRAASYADQPAEGGDEHG